MKTAWGLAGAGLVLAILIAACVGDDPSDVAGSSGSDSAKCTETQKSCNGVCASKDDPNAGCAAPLCTPCSAVANAVPACNGGACSFACSAGFSDCDGDPANGCEAKSSSDPANCGGCGTVCGTQNTDGAPKCETGKCVFTCKQGFAHCGAAGDTGCETDLLTNAENCGACGHSCLGGKCAAGKCEPLKLASASYPRGVAVDATNVYFTIISPGPSIQRIQRDGKCTPASPCPQEFAGSSLGDGSGATAGFRGPIAPFSDGTTLYWVNQAGSSVARRAVTGGTMSFISGAPAGSAENGNLVVAGGKVWWTNGFASADPTTHVYKTNLDGTGVATVASYASPATTFDGKGGITADATHVYWVSEHSGVFKAALSADTGCVEGTNCTSVVTSGGSSSPVGVAVDESFVYWTEAGGTIRKAPKGGGASTFVAMNQATPRAIATMGGFVYWTTTDAIRRAPQSAAVCDGTGCELVANVASPDALVAADDGLYWSSNVVSGGVYRLAK